MPQSPALAFLGRGGDHAPSTHFPQIEGPLFEGNGYLAHDLPRVPETLEQAIAAFSASDFPKKAFGGEVVEHLLHFARTELKASQRAVTDFERARYFERI